MKLLILLSILSLFAVSIKAAHYAVLVAGSNEFYNYRHQADVFHAYQILTGYGIPKENIITMAYDDIAHDRYNPFPGQVFNKPSNGVGRDVYNGVVIDYRRGDVTPQNFLNVLIGDSEATNGKKVLETTSEDNIFIYFADHGAPGLLAFPDDYLYADDFVATLQRMHERKMYQSMVVYIEACESGSIFSGLLPTDIKVYATTASNAEENSWAAYCTPNDIVNGTEIGSCLGDLFSVNFLENLESVDPVAESLDIQFSIVAQQTNLSHVQRFGDLSLAETLVTEFEADGNSYLPLFLGAEIIFGKYASMNSADADDTGRYSNVDSRMVKLNYLERRHTRHNTEDTHKELLQEINEIKTVDSIFNNLQRRFELNLNQGVAYIDFGCLKQRMGMYQDICGKLSDYGLKYVKNLYHTCEQDVNANDFKNALEEFCL